MSHKAAHFFNVKHYIVTKGPPIAERPHRLTPEKYITAKKELR